MKYLAIIIFCISYSLLMGQINNLESTRTNLKGHWKLIETKLLKTVPFIPQENSTSDAIHMASEDSPWDHYTAYDLVFENDSMYKVHYPIQAFETVRYVFDTNYLHITAKNYHTTYPAQFIHDTLTLYIPVSTEPGYFKETYIPTNFNDSILNLIKKYGINYPALAGTWILIREKDYDYGTHFELKFAHSIPDSIVFTQEQMLYALDHTKIYMMQTDGIKRAYSFKYDDHSIYFTPGKWYKKKEAPMIHFYRE